MSQRMVRTLASGQQHDVLFSVGNDYGLYTGDTQQSVSIVSESAACDSLRESLTSTYLWGKFPLVGHFRRSTGGRTSDRSRPSQQRATATRRKRATKKERTHQYCCRIACTRTISASAYDRGLCSEVKGYRCKTASRGPTSDNPGHTGFFFLFS